MSRKSESGARPPEPKVGGPNPSWRAKIQAESRDPCPSPATVETAQSDFQRYKNDTADPACVSASRLTIGSLFSGIGGIELGLEWAGLGPVVYQVESDEYCRAVLARHWPEAMRYEDVRAVGVSLPDVDIICGGSPCQGFSSAGLGRGLQDDRSGLWWEFVRIVAAKRPTWVVVENVASGKSRWLRHFRHHLHMLGYRTRALGIAARDCGAPHRRPRIAIVAHADKERRNQRADSGKGASRQGGDAAKGRGPGRLRTWTAEPDVGRVAHGIPHRVDRLRALGNAVVPQCAQVVGEVIKRWAQADEPRGYRFAQAVGDG